MILLDLASKFIIQRLTHYFYNIRIFDWKAYLGIAVLGFARNMEVASFNWQFYRILKFAVTTILYLAFSFSINNCFDIKCDIHERRKLKKNPIAARYITLREGLILSLSLAFTGLVLSYLWFDKYCFLIYFMLVFLGAAYSAPPFRLKSIPLMDLFSHSLFFGALLYLYGAFSSGNINVQETFLALSISLYSIILELRNHLEDYWADLNSETRTTVCWLGYVRSLRLLKILLLIHWTLLTGLSWMSSIFYSTITLTLIILAASKLMKLKFSLLLRMMDLYTCVMYILLSFQPFTVMPLNLG